MDIADGRGRNVSPSDRIRALDVLARYGECRAGSHSHRLEGPLRLAASLPDSWGAALKGLHRARDLTDGFGTGLELLQWPENRASTADYMALATRTGVQRSVLVPSPTCP